MHRDERRSVIGKLRVAAVSVALALAGTFAPAAALAETQPMDTGIQLQEYKRFADVNPDEWYVTAGCLDYVVDNGLLTGYNATTFGPHDEITRGQIAVILHRMAGEPKADSQAFGDVDYDQYYGPAIRWARETKVVNGYTGTNDFGPENRVTRQEFAAMLANYAKNIAELDVSSDGAKLDSIDGAAEVADWARPSMGWAVDNGLISGVVHADGTSWIEPNGSATRCQASKMITVLHRDVMNQGSGSTDDPADPDYPSEDYDGPTRVEFTGEVVGAISDSAIASQDGNDIEIVTADNRYKVGDIVTLNPSEEFPYGTAVKIESVESADGLTEIRGTVPHPDEVYESVAINEQFDTDDVLNALKSDVDLQSIEISDNSLTISKDFGKYGSVSGTVTINDIDAHVIYIAPPTLLSVIVGYTDIDLNADLTADLDLELSTLPGDARRIKLGPQIPLPVAGAPGIGCNLQFYLEVDITGHVTASADIQVSTNIHRDFIGFHEITGDSDIDLGDTLSVAVGGSAGVNLSLGLYFILPDPLVEGGIGAGLETEVELTMHPGLICGDAAVWAYANAAVSFLDKPDGDLSAVFLDRDNSPFEASIHVEDGEFVPKCTWEDKENDPGSDDSGTDADNPDYDGIPIPDEGYGFKPQWTRAENGRAALAEPFYVDAGQSITIKAPADKNCTAMFGIDGGNSLVRRTERTEHNTFTYVYQGSSMFTGGGHDGESTTVEVLVGRLKVWSMYGWGQMYNGVREYVEPIVTFGACEQYGYPVQLSATSITLKVGQSFELSATQTVDDIYSAIGTEYDGTDDWALSSSERGKVLYERLEDSKWLITAEEPGTTTLNVCYGHKPRTTRAGFNRQCIVNIIE